MSNMVMSADIIPENQKDLYCIEDKIYLIYKKYSKAIFSHLTSMYLNLMIPSIPKYQDVTFGLKKNERTHNYDFNVHYCAEEHLSIGVVRSYTVFGNEVYCFDPERTLCGILMENPYDTYNNYKYIQVYNSYSYRNLNRLKAYSKLFKIEEYINQYNLI